MCLSLYFYGIYRVLIPILTILPSLLVKVRAAPPMMRTMVAQNSLDVLVG